MSRVLRCGLHGLPAAETVLVRTLFKLYQHGANDFGWVLVDAAPYDALLVDSRSDSAGAGSDPRGATTILTVGPVAEGSAAPNLARPLRSEVLEAWLVQTQRQLLGQVTASARVQEAQPPSPQAAPVADLQDAVPYKLLRWPPAAMLRNDPNLIRMATLLSRRPLSVGELARISQQSLDSACAFLQTLRKAALLDGPAPLHAGLPSRSGSIAPAPVPFVRKVERSLMHRIRLRLGL
jgi:hypothetical protein